MSRIRGVVSARPRARGAREPFAADRLDVVAVLESDAERLLQRGRIGRLAIERLERGYPIQRFRHAGRFGKLGGAKLVDDRRDLPGELRRRVWRAPWMIASSLSKLG